MFPTSETYSWSFVTQIFHNGQPSHGDRKTFDVMTSTKPRGTIGSVASLLAAVLYQVNPDRISTSIPCQNGVKMAMHLVSVSRINIVEFHTQFNFQER